MFPLNEGLDFLWRFSLLLHKRTRVLCQQKISHNRLKWVIIAPNTKLECKIRGPCYLICKVSQSMTCRSLLYFPIQAWNQLLVSSNEKSGNFNITLRNHIICQPTNHGDKESKMAEVIIWKVWLKNLQACMQKQIFFTFRVHSDKR